MKITFVYNMKIKTRQQITALFDLSWESMCKELQFFTILNTYVSVDNCDSSSQYWFFGIILKFSKYLPF